MVRSHAVQHRDHGQQAEHAIQPVLAGRIRPEPCRDHRRQCRRRRHAEPRHGVPQRRGERDPRRFRALAARQFQPKLPQRLGRIDFGQRDAPLRQQPVQLPREGPERDGRIGGQRRRQPVPPGRDRGLPRLVRAECPEHWGAGRARCRRAVAKPQQRRGIRQAKGRRMRRARHPLHAARRVEGPRGGDGRERRADLEERRIARPRREERRKIALRPPGCEAARQPERQVEPERHRHALGQQRRQQRRRVAHGPGCVRHPAARATPRQRHPTLARINAPIGVGGEHHPAGKLSS